MSAVKKDKTKKGSNPAAEAAWVAYIDAKIAEYEVRIAALEKK